MILLSSQKILEDIQEQNTKVEAIKALIVEEKREPTDEETKAINAWFGTDEAPGEYDKLKAALDSAEKREAKEKEIKALGSKILGEKLDEHVQTGGGQTPSKVVVPAAAKRHGKLKAFDNDAEGEKAAYIAGRLVAATIYNHQPSREWAETHGFEAAMSHNDGNQSSVLVPVEMETAIIRLVESYGLARQYCSIEPMGSMTKTVPVRVGGMTAYPVGETTTANEGSNTGTQTEPEYSRLELVARKWKAWLKMSDELNEDSLVQLGDNIAQETALAFAYAEDNCLFNGDGSSTYHKIEGVLNAVNAGSVYTAATGNTQFETLDLLDFEKAVGQLADYPGINPAWFISKEGYYASIARLQMAAGGNTVQEIAGMPVRMFLGHPVVFSNVLNKTLSAQTDTKIAVFGDLNMGVKFGDRRDMTMSVTDQRYWDEDQIAIKATERFDINVHSKGTSTAGDAGAIVVIQTPAS